MKKMYRKRTQGSANNVNYIISRSSALCKPLLLVILCVCICISAASVRRAQAASQDLPEETLKLESGFYYTVEKRDTLWDISEHFYDYAWLWPDLWEKNPHITNPHLIYPGERIRLFSRQELKTILAAKGKGEAELPPMPAEPAYYSYPAIDSVGFIREKRVNPSGAIFKIKLIDKAMMGGGRDFVYVRPAEGTIFEIGDRFTVFRNFKPLTGVEKRIAIGVQHYFTGVVEITDVKPEFSIAKIVKFFRPIEVNDLLMPYEAPSPKIVLIESQEGLQGKIIVSEEHQEIIGDLNVVFIDKGRQDGVRVGQSYSVFYQEREYLDPAGRESVLLSPVDFAEILILRTEETTATALVTMSEQAIHPGEKIRTSSYLHLLTAASPDLETQAE